MAKTLARAYIHTQGDLINKINKAKNISLYIGIYKIDQLVI